VELHGCLVNDDFVDEVFGSVCSRLVWILSLECDVVLELDLGGQAIFKDEQGELR
jgi:hypothetical protein